MTSLFTETAHYTREANALDSATAAALAPIFRSFVAQGYSPREISHIMAGVVRDIEQETLIIARAFVDADQAVKAIQEVQ